MLFIADIKKRYSDENGYCDITFVNLIDKKHAQLKLGEAFLDVVDYYKKGQSKHISNNDDAEKLNFIWCVIK